MTLIKTSNKDEDKPQLIVGAYTTYTHVVGDSLDKKSISTQKAMVFEVRTTAGPHKKKQLSLR
ncbi:MAG: hypothetical protein VXZ35_06340, partial [Pseudomonadota bacterium]|nr:hypothetical protein [Pseudomonadota bacterium]